MPLGPGSKVADRYTVLSELGRGGVATVWLVRHDALHTLFALKVLSVGSPALADRLVQEARIQAMLRHPNAVAAYDLVEVPGGIGLVLEYVHGPSLRTVLARHRLTPGQAHWLFRGVAAGVARAHAVGLVHRDLKPANVLLQVDEDALARPSTARVVPKVTDFGLAKVFDAVDAHATRTGAALGTPAYMSPEQVRDASAVDARSDVFSLGSLAYELLTGERPFEGTDPADTLLRVREVRYPPLAPTWPTPLVDAIERALVADPARRFGSVAEMAEVWARWDGEGDAADTLAKVCARLIDPPAADSGLRTPSPGWSTAWSVPKSGSTTETWNEDPSDSPAPPPPRVEPAAATRPNRVPAAVIGALLGAGLFGAGMVVASAVLTPPGAGPVVVAAPPPPPPPAPVQIATPPKPIAEVPPARPGAPTPAQRAANQVNFALTDLTTEAMKGKSDLRWLREVLPQRVREAQALGADVEKRYPDDEASLQAQYYVAMVEYLSYTYRQYAAAPSAAPPEEKAEWERAVAQELRPAGQESLSRARAGFEALSRSTHPLAADSIWPRSARQMLAAIDLAQGN